MDTPLAVAPEPVLVSKQVVLSNKGAWAAITDQTDQTGAASTTETNDEYAHYERRRAEQHERERLAIEQRREQEAHEALQRDALKRAHDENQLRLEEIERSKSAAAAAAVMAANAERERQRELERAKAQSQGSEIDLHAQANMMDAGLEN